MDNKDGEGDMRNPDSEPEVEDEEKEVDGEFGKVEVLDTEREKTTDLDFQHCKIPKYTFSCHDCFVGNFTFRLLQDREPGRSSRSGEAGLPLELHQNHRECFPFDGTAGDNGAAERSKKRKLTDDLGVRVVRQPDQEIRKSLWLGQPQDARCVSQHVKEDRRAGGSCQVSISPVLFDLEVESRYSYSGSQTFKDTFFLVWRDSTWCRTRFQRLRTWTAAPS